MDKEKSGNNGGGIKHRLAQMFLHSACSADTNNTSTSFITSCKLGTTGTKQVNEVRHGRPSLFDLLNKHRYEKKTSTSYSRKNTDQNARTVPVVQISIDCTRRRSLHCTNKLVPEPISIPTKENEETNKIKKKSNSRKCSPISSSSPSTKFYYTNPETMRKKSSTKPKRKGTKKLHWNSYGFSASSSAHSDIHTGLFSSEGEEEAHTLFSSKSFSSDSTEFYHHTNKPKTQLNSKPPLKKPVMKPVAPTPKTKETGTGIGTETGKGSGVAVVRKSSNPYMDFRSSMVEMILEERLVCVKEMERLLQSYLALNAKRHHPIIIKAFEDICETIFCK